MLYFPFILYIYFFYQEQIDTFEDDYILPKVIYVYWDNLENNKLLYNNIVILYNYYIKTNDDKLNRIINLYIKDYDIFFTRARLMIRYQFAPDIQGYSIGVAASF